MSINKNLDRMRRRAYDYYVYRHTIGATDEEWEKQNEKIRKKQEPLSDKKQHTVDMVWATLFIILGGLTFIFCIGGCLAGRSVDFVKSGEIWKWDFFVAIFYTLGCLSCAMLTNTKKFFLIIYIVGMIAVVGCNAYALYDHYSYQAEINRLLNDY